MEGGMISRIFINDNEDGRYIEYMDDNDVHLLVISIENQFDVRPGELNGLLDNIRLNGLAPNLYIDQEAMEFFAHYNIDILDL
jgi:hypothetical protein